VHEKSTRDTNDRDKAADEHQHQMRSDASFTTCLFARYFLLFGNFQLAHWEQRKRNRLRIDAQQPENCLIKAWAGFPRSEASRSFWNRTKAREDRADREHEQRETS